MTSVEAWMDAVRELASEVGGDSQTLIERVGRAIEAGAAEIRAEDLALAYAVADGNEKAMARLEALAGGEIAKAARAISRDSDFVDEVGQQTRVRLCVGEQGAPPRIASYRGAGPLRAWVAVAAHRVALNALRERRASTTTTRADALTELASHEPDPELRYLKTMYQADFRLALGEAISEAGDSQRALLRLRFVDRLELAPIARLYGVHESTISRRLSAALAAIGRATREKLVARLSISDDTAASVARMVRSQLDLSIARLLAD